MGGIELSPEELELFLTESTEMVDTMEELLVTLETEGGSEAVAAIFRAAHTLKGGAATAGMENIARLTHALESLLDLVRSGERAVDADLVDALLEAVDVLRRCLAAVKEDGTDESVDVGGLAARLEALAQEPPGGTPGLSGRADGPSGQAAPASQGSTGTAAGEPVQEASRKDGSGKDESGKLARLSGQVAEGERVFRFIVDVEPDAAMPSIRLYQALMVFEEHGRVLQSNPTVKEIEETTADHTRLEALVVTAENPQDVQAALAEVSHLRQVSWEAVGGPSDKPDEGAGRGPAPGPAGAGGAPSRQGAGSSGPGRKPPGSGGDGPAAPSAAPMADTIRVSVRVLDRLMNLVGELVIDRTRLARLGHVDLQLQELQEELELVSGHLSRITAELQDTIMQARMVPLETLFRKFPRMVRDLARRLGKDVRFEILGEDTELDRAVIEQISDPLVHLIRNAVDHGLEPPQDRVAAGKSAQGLVRLSAYHQENNIYIEVADDGRGIDAERVKRTAVARGLLTADEAQQLHPAEALELLFLPGFSTAGQVTDVSGRGVGLDVVKKNIERVNGTVSIQSDPGRGTRFIIRLPLTLAIVQALLVNIRGTMFAVPLDSIVEILLVGGERVRMANGWPMVPVRDQVIPLVNPGDVWGAAFAAAWREDASNPVVVLRSGAGPLALAVDRLIGEQEIVIKTIDGMGGQVPGISGASILGDGSVALILDVTGFTKEVRRLGTAFRGHGGHFEKSA
ncbi:MAG: chemotaxis protein CheA [Firmicutes bacterium]|nr:chemotaxis protein CheA [Bacillota bacterium]